MIRPHPLLKLATLVCVAALAACSGPGGTKKSASSGSASSASRGGGYYLDDGPGSNIPADLDAIPDAIPRVEKHAAGNFKPYTAMGKRYVPIKDNSAFREVGTASWYGRKFHGRKTANGEVYDMYAMTAATPRCLCPATPVSRGPAPANRSLCASTTAAPSTARASSICLMWPHPGSG